MKKIISFAKKIKKIKIIFMGLLDNIGPEMGLKLLKNFFEKNNYKTMVLSLNENGEIETIFYKEKVEVIKETKKEK